MSPWQTPLSLSLLIKGVSAIVDGTVIHINADNVTVEEEEKRIEVILTRNESKGVECQCVFYSNSTHSLVHVRKTPVFAHESAGRRHHVLSSILHRRLPLRHCPHSRPPARRFLLPQHLGYRILPAGIRSQLVRLLRQSAAFPPAHRVSTVSLDPHQRGNRGNRGNWGNQRNQGYQRN